MMEISIKSGNPSSASIEDGNPVPDYDVSTRKDDATKCGIGGCHPSFLQHFAKIGCFTGFYSMAGLLTSTLSVYVNSQVTTLERQFGFSSKQTALIMAANDIGFLLFVLFVSHLASLVHIPRALGLATIIYGISGMICSLPHFIYGHSLNQNLDKPTDTTSDLLVNQSSYMRNEDVEGQLCRYDDILSASERCELSDGDSKNSRVINQHAALSSLIIIVIGMVLQGLGKSPRSSFTITYIDNNTKHVKTGFFVGIVIALSIFGPALAFLMGGLFTRMYVTLEKTNLHPKHPLWIGAWWLGYLVFGTIAIFVSLPLFCFPRKLPRKSQGRQVETKTANKIYKGNDLLGPTKVKDSQDRKFGNVPQKCNINGTQDNVHHASKMNNKAVRQIKEFALSSLRIWTNPIFMLIVFSNCFIIFMVGGTHAYTPKYLEGIFDLPAHRANYIMAVKTLAASCVGTFIGGYLSKRLKMTALKALMFTVVVVVASSIFTILAFFFYCDQPETHNKPGSMSDCSSDCQCEDNTYFPVCGVDGLTYYSPCSAGCQIGSDGNYYNCTCIEGGTATGGICPYGCNHVYLYAVVTGMRSLLGTLAIVPKITVMIRSVQARDKALALGFGALMSSLFGWLLGPIVFGFVIDGVCSIWDVKCGITGRCLLYDNYMFRLQLHGYALIGMVGSFSCQITALIYAKCTGCLDDTKPESAESLLQGVNEKGQGNGEITKKADVHKDTGNKDDGTKEELERMMSNETQDHIYNGNTECRADDAGISKIDDDKIASKAVDLSI